MRFRNGKQSGVYLSLILVNHRSGEKASNSEKTFKGNK
ncbi:hypothetical protein DW190_21645 [Bacteroides caccae]|uniref:Uncharacterized protein n=1 Tax=Bacteroides caccae TaxID=47678 RepID=A0A414YDW0_9BACE|nr:hypothetical protein DW190_21645 [Bacteroides caccae]